MADTYAQAISMIADWLPFLAEAEAGLQTKMDKQTGDNPAAPPPVAPTITAPVLAAPPAPAVTPTPTAPAVPVAPPGPAAADAEVWDEDTFDGWTEDMTTAAPDEEGEIEVVDEAAAKDEEMNLFGDEGIEVEDNKETPSEDDLFGSDLDEPEAEVGPAPPVKSSRKKKPAADENDWLTGISQ